MPQILKFTDRPGAELERLIAELAPVSTFILTDSHTRTLCLPALIAESPALEAIPVIEIPSGDVNKNIESLTHVWNALVEGEATRRSLLVNIGGGMVTDLGGFAAATFKRGIRFINMPTTLLGSVDAAVGGKTGINFHGLKNEIGAFRPADAVIISARFFTTLPTEEIMSGYGEMLKHALLSGDEALNRALRFSPADNPAGLLPLLRESVEVKTSVVESDPFEKGPRKALNLGHTFAHAFESLAFDKGHPVPHGIAVAWGLVADLVLSHMILKFPADTLRRVARYVEENYPRPSFTCRDYPALLGFMAHDKKNATSHGINFTLLRRPGEPQIDCIADNDRIMAALDITRDLFHI